jgi:hypothetical protein
LNDWQKAALREQWGTMQKVLSSRSRMERVVEDIEGPRSRHAAEQRDKLAPFHCQCLPVLSTERIAHLATAQGCCAAAFQSSLCRSWH